MKKPIPSDVTTWPADLRYLYEERAGIKEFDGNTPRNRAEREARLETWAAQQSGELFTEAK